MSARSHMSTPLLASSPMPPHMAPLHQPIQYASSSHQPIQYASSSHQPIQHVSSSHQPIQHASSSHQHIQHAPGLFLQQFPPSPIHAQPGFTPQLPPLEINDQSPALVIDAPIPTLSQSPYSNALGFTTQASPNLSPNYPPSRPPSSVSSYLQGPSISRPQSRSPGNFDQREFNTCVGRITVAAGLPISWTDNPEVRSTFRKFFPWAQLPSRKTLSRSILPALQASLRAQSQKETRGTNCTLQCDGWTAMNMHHLIAFMITVWPKVCTYVVCFSTMPHH